MAFVAVATTVGATVLGTGVAAGIGSTIVGGALLGAGAGGLYSAISGDGDILNSMLTGAMFGGLGAGIGGALFPGAAGIAPATTTGALGSGSALASQAAAPAATAVNTVTPAMQAAALDAAAVAEGSTVAGMVPAANTGLAANTVLPASMQFTAPAAQTAAGLTGKEMLGYGLAGTTALSLLGGKQKGAGAGQMPDPGSIRPFEYTSTPVKPTGDYPSPYATARYESSGNPILDTRERNYFDQDFTALQPYSAKTGAVNPNVPLPSSSPIAAAGGGIMRGYDDELGGDYSAMGMDQGNMQKGLFGRGYANGGDVDLDEERNKMIMKNIKGASTKELEKTLGLLNQQEFLRKNMPAYSEAMRPSISGMVEAAQHGDRMAQAQGGQPRDINIMPTVVDPQRGMYGGIAQIGQNIDPQTRVNAMADIQRTPYDRNAMDSVRRVGVGVDRQIGKDANLSAFYEQDPMGRSKMGGARYTQRFEQGGPVKNYALGGLTLIEDMIRQAEQGQMPKYQFDQNAQRYNTVNQPMMGAGLGGYRFDPNTDRYETSAQPMAAGGMTSLGGYSDGGRMLKGPGDGMSDDIPGVIGNKQPARLADGEFVVPADVVSHLGNGSTDAGAKRLYAMMDKVRKARTGNKKQGKQIKAEKYLPA
tara:strand:- start:421 stop:2358 length:1938 start_codon:yes stop_codon:yes gene_type:complete